MDYNVKTVSTDFSGNIRRKCPICPPDLYLPDWMTASPHLDHSTGPKPIQLVQVVLIIEDQKSLKSPHGNPLKKDSLSDNAVKKDEGVLCQPFQA